jgi:tRNA (cytidine32/uridine32-2'-O)-methyltransferase
MAKPVFTMRWLFAGNTSMNFSNIRIVLVETSHPGNIGAAARAMMNMGLGRLVLVKPRHWPSAEALSMAASALQVLDDAVVVDTLAQAVADCHVVIGTSARLRDMPIPLLDPAQCAAKVLDLPQSQQVALVFGREISGLTNEELHRCHYHVHIPVNPEYSSLNLAAAVMVLCYELRKTALLARDKSVAKPLDGETAEWDQQPAKAEDVERFLAHLETVLIRLDFHKPQYKRPLMRRLRRLYQRVQLDQMEVNILRGILTAIEHALEKGEFPIKIREIEESLSIVEQNSQSNS